MEAPDFYANFIKVAGDDCANEDCTKTKYEPINDLNDFSQSYDLLNYIPYINQDNKRKDATQMDFFSGCGCHSKVRSRQSNIIRLSWVRSLLFKLNIDVKFYFFAE